MKKTITFCLFAVFVLGAYLYMQTPHLQVRRVIGNSGDRIEIRSGVVFINDMPATLWKTAR